MSRYNYVKIFSPITPDSERRYSLLYCFDRRNMPGEDRRVREYRHISLSSRMRLERVLNSAYVQQNKLGENLQFPAVYISQDSIAVSYIFYIHKES